MFHERKKTNGAKWLLYNHEAVDKYRYDNYKAAAKIKSISIIWVCEMFLSFDMQQFLFIYNKMLLFL